MERPNTVAGLLAKRNEVSRELKRVRDLEKHLNYTLAALDTVLAAFEPDGVPRAHPKVTRHRAVKGSQVRLVMGMLREATKPLTSLDFVEEQIKQRKLKADDNTKVMLRKRIGACLTKLKNDGFVRVVPLEGLYQGWELVR